MWYGDYRYGRSQRKSIKKLVALFKKIRRGDQVMYIAALKNKYKDEIVAALMKEFGYSS